MSMATKRSTGKIITFYSYKGGTGRSFVLANVAFLLACQGKKVCVIDFDLEAPGLHRYFSPFLEDPDLEFTDGLIDWLWSTADTQMGSGDVSHRAGDLDEYAVSLGRPGWTFPRGGQLDFIPAGRQDAEYGKRMTSFDWAAFYDRLGGGLHIEQARLRLKADYDFVLVDSRTGVSDTAGICTVTLPDRLVACYTLNKQSINGVDQTLSRIQVQRAKRNLEILPIESRIETNEKAKLDAARAYARPRLSRYVSGDADRSYWDDMEVVYWPFYAFEECLAIFAEDTRTQTKLSMLDTVRRIAGRVSADPIGSPTAIEVPTFPQEIRDAIMADYILGPHTRDANPVALDGVFAEVLVRFHAHELGNPGTLMRAATIADLDAAGPLPPQLANDEGFLRYLIDSRDLAERRAFTARLILLAVFGLAVTLMLFLFVTRTFTSLDLIAASGVGLLGFAIGAQFLRRRPNPRRSSRSDSNS